MVNYKAYKILSKIAEPGLILFELEDYIEHEGLFHGRKIKGKGYIGCENHPPYSNYKVGDWLEVDLDRIGDKNSSHTFDDTSIVRKVGSSAVVSSSSGGLTIPTTPSSAVEVARTVTQTVLDHADRTGGTPQIEIGTDKTSIRYYPPKK